MKRGRCGCSMFCRNPAMVVIDFKAPMGAMAGVTGWKTKRICVPAARSLLADIVVNEAEAQEVERRRTAPAGKQDGKGGNK